MWTRNKRKYGKEEGNVGKKGNKEECIVGCAYFALGRTPQFCEVQYSAYLILLDVEKLFIVI